MIGRRKPMATFNVEYRSDRYATYRIRVTDGRVLGKTKSLRQRWNWVRDKWRGQLPTMAERVRMAQRATHVDRLPMFLRRQAD